MWGRRGTFADFEANVGPINGVNGRRRERHGAEETIQSSYMGVVLLQLRWRRGGQAARHGDVRIREFIYT